MYSQQNIQTDLSCDECHSPGKWAPLSSKKKFHHSSTFFPLLGRHLQAGCIQCHNGETVQKRHDFTRANSECATCHLDIHSGSFGESCSDCHTVKSWNHMGQWSGHDFTSFPLVGAHNRVDCHSCHIQSPASLISSECLSCHTLEYSVALATGLHPENESCEQCHNSRSFSRMDMGRHDILFFPINSGKHKGEWSSCMAECHTFPADYTQFSCGLNGVCHEHDQDDMDDEHDDESGYRYESQSCLSCHPNGEAND